MSIINDALKKAQLEKTPTTAPEEKVAVAETPVGIIKVAPEDERPVVSKDKEQPKKNYFMTYIMIIAVSTLTIFTIFIFLKEEINIPFFNNNANMSPGPSFESSKAAAPVAVKVYSKESGQIVQKPEFCVTGIIHGDGSPMAVINGVVYTCGETIRGATVAKISENEVVLQRFGKRIELKVK